MTDKKHNYIGIASHRIKTNPREKAFADQWHENNDNHSWSTNTLDALFKEPCNKGDEGAYSLPGIFNGYERLPLGAVTVRDRIVSETVIQWLGSNCGMSFLESALKKFGYRLEKIK